MAVQKKVDVVVVGVGWVRGIIAAELTKAGLNVLGLERGHLRGRNTGDWMDSKFDELRYAITYDLFQDAANEPWTLRHNLREPALPLRQPFQNAATERGTRRHSLRETALPLRQLGSSLPGTGLGGAGVHWNGQTWRFHPRDFTMYTSTGERARASFIPRGI